MLLQKDLESHRKVIEMVLGTRKCHRKGSKVLEKDLESHRKVIEMVLGTRKCHRKGSKVLEKDLESHRNFLFIYFLLLQNALTFGGRLLSVWRLLSGKI